MRLSTTGIPAALLAALVASPAPAQPSAFIAPGAVADAPQGFIDLCRRDPALCRSEVAPPIPAGPAPWSLPVIGLAAGPASMAMAGTAAIEPYRAPGSRRGRAGAEAAVIGYDARDPARTLKAVNRQVNRQVIQISDLASVGVAEEWDRPGRIGRPAGDCEDIAIEKRMRLIEGGFPPERLFFAVVYRSHFGLHTVLVARLDDADVVLDSATPRIVPWSRAGYVWLRVQTPRDPLNWTEVAATGPAAPPA